MADAGFPRRESLTPIGRNFGLFFRKTAWKLIDQGALPWRLLGSVSVAGYCNVFKFPRNPERIAKLLNTNNNGKNVSLADPRGGRQGRAPPGGPISFIFMQFSAKICKIIAIFGVGAPTWGKSWIRYCVWCGNGSRKKVWGRIPHVSNNKDPGITSDISVPDLHRSHSVQTTVRSRTRSIPAFRFQPDFCDRETDSHRFTTWLLNVPFFLFIPSRT